LRWPFADRRYSGVGKTTLAHTLAKLLGYIISRIQFTSDILPVNYSTSVFDAKNLSFKFHPGPIFNQMVIRAMN